MRDLLGEKTAIDQTQAILKNVDISELPKQKQKELVRRIYDNQLKKFTAYTRLQRRKLVMQLYKKGSK